MGTEVFLSDWYRQAPDASWCGTCNCLAQTYGVLLLTNAYWRGGVIRVAG